MSDFQVVEDLSLLDLGQLCHGFGIDHDFAFDDEIGAIHTRYYRLVWHVIRLLPLVSDPAQNKLVGQCLFINRF